jgi:tetratricopeptide (TPR) repeat protein
MVRWLKNSHRISAALAVAAALATSLLSQTASAQNIDTLFRQFNAAMDSEDYAQAERVANRMLSSSPTQAWQAASLNSLGRACHNLKRLEEAERHLKRAMTISLPADATNTGWIPNNLARVYKDQKKFDEAEAMFRRALSFFERLKGVNSSEYATVTANLANLRHDQGRYREGETYAQRAYEIRKIVYGDAHSDVAASLSQLADMSRHMEEFDTAEARYKASLKMREQVHGPSSSQVGWCLHYLGVCYRDAERWADAEPVVRRALKIREEKFGAASEAARDSMELLAAALEKQGKQSESAELRERIAAVATTTATPAAGTGKLKIKSPVASVYDGQTVLTSIKADEEYSFTRTSGNSYLITVDVGGKQRLGWVKGPDVHILPPPNLASAANWQPVTPPRSRFRAAFPSSPKATTQTISGVTARAFTAETPSATYLVSYFDLPTDKHLTFDTGIDAYAAAKSGSVKSKKSYEFELYPGREAVVALPDGSFSRLRILTVNRRWYQIGIEGTADVINNDDASRFLNSFALAD